jgi:hypothetical protein
MKEITTREDLALLDTKRSIVFFDTQWSGYSKISRQMVEFVESYATAGKLGVATFTGPSSRETASLWQRK